jgi:hypothetical protein
VMAGEELAGDWGMALGAWLAVLQPINKRPAVQISQICGETLFIRTFLFNGNSFDAIPLMLL